ncbi:hypothetical protein HK405_005602, partial [Cladochytrium tenue]
DRAPGESNTSECGTAAASRWTQAAARLAATAAQDLRLQVGGTSHSVAAVEAATVLAAAATAVAEGAGSKRAAGGSTAESVSLASAENRDPGAEGGSTAGRAQQKAGEGDDNGAGGAGEHRRARRLRMRREAYRERQRRRDSELQWLRKAKEELVSEVAALEEGVPAMVAERTVWLECELEYLQK